VRSLQKIAGNNPQTFCNLLQIVPVFHFMPQRFFQGEQGESGEAEEVGTDIASLAWRPILSPKLKVAIDGMMEALSDAAPPRPLLSSL
jgi:hypothetical protein